MSGRSWDYVIRPIRAEDDEAVASIIRTVMTSYGLDRPGSAMHDAEVSAMAAEYGQPGRAYFVAEKDGEIWAAGGVAPLEGGDAGTCELRKMYSRSEVRGIGLGKRLLETCLAAARELGYKRCYLETLSEMAEARRLYERSGFVRAREPRGDTGHFVCDIWYVREL